MSEYPISIVGTKLPNLILSAFHNNEIKKIDLSQLNGKWAILFFYPADFTFVCPTELKDLANKYEEIKLLNVEVYSVSTDTVYAHKAWHDSSDSIKNVKFPMLADSNGELCKKLGVYIADEGVSYRATIIVDPDSIIQSYEVNNNGIGRNATELVRKLKALKFVREHGDQVCPANWEPGQKTLHKGIDLIGKI